MPQPHHVDPGPFIGGDGKKGVLLIHGFTGSVAEVRGLAEHLTEEGFRVRAPLLPGHGTRPEDLDAIRFSEWIRAVDQALDRLRLETDVQYVAGLSLGSLLTLHLAVHRPEIHAIACLSPPLKTKTRLWPLTVLIRHLIKRPPIARWEDQDMVDEDAMGDLWCYDETSIWGAAEVYLLVRRVKRILAQIQQPMLVVQARGDGLVHARSAAILDRRAVQSSTRVHWLENSGHNLLVDADRLKAFAVISEFFHQPH